MKIVVLAGGISTERDVSLSSGRMIYRALKKKGHQAVLIDVYLGYEAREEDVFSSSRDWAESIGGVGAEDPDVERIRAMRPDGDKSFFGPGALSVCQQADMVFLALHGEDGENGKIQAAMDLMGIKYTGTDYLSSALAMNKAVAKELFAQNGILTPRLFDSRKEAEKGGEIEFPCVVKVCSGGSSVGVYICENKEAYEKAKREALRYDREILTEEYIRGREFSVGVIDGRALPVIEIAPVSGFYDYKNKYQAGSAVETCPADISEDAAKRMKQAAEDVFRVLRMKVYARMDFMMNEKEEIFCLEANTLPGMTPTSLLPQEAKAEGIAFEELCEKLIQVSLKKYE